MSKKKRVSVGLAETLREAQVKKRKKSHTWDSWPKSVTSLIDEIVDLKKGSFPDLYATTASELVRDKFPKTHINRRILKDYCLAVLDFEWS